MLYALLLQRSNRTTVTERDIFAKLTLWVLLHAPVRESASPRENVNVKVHSSLPLEGIRTLEASEQAQKSVKNKPIVGTCNKHKTYYIHKEANAYTIKQYIQIIPNQPETNNMQFILTNFNGNKGFTFPKFDKHPFDNAVSIIREDATDDACYKAEIKKMEDTMANAQACWDAKWKKSTTERVKEGLQMIARQCSPCCKRKREESDDDEADKRMRV